MDVMWLALCAADLGSRCCLVEPGVLRRRGGYAAHASFCPCRAPLHPTDRLPMITSAKDLLLGDGGGVGSHCPDLHHLRGKPQADVPCQLRSKCSVRPPTSPAAPTACKSRSELVCWCAAGMRQTAGAACALTLPSSAPGGLHAPPGGGPRSSACVGANAGSRVASGSTELRQGTPSEMKLR